MATAAAIRPGENLRAQTQRPAAQSRRPAPADQAPAARPRTASPRPSAFTPVKVPRARKLPSNFVTQKESGNDLGRACDLGLRLVREGVVELLAPEEGENVIHHLGRCWAKKHEAALDAADVHLEIGAASDWNGKMSLSIEAFAPRTSAVSLTRFRRACLKVHPWLFGAIVEELSTLLAAYSPLFTAADAVQVQEYIHYGDEWFTQTWESLMENMNEDAPGFNADVGERDLVNWARRQRMPTPYDLGHDFPWPLYSGGQQRAQVLALLDTPRCDGLPGIETLREVRGLLQTLAERFSYDRRDTPQHMHPGHVTVIMAQSATERFDPVWESWQEFNDMAGETDLLSPYSNYEPLQSLSVDCEEDNETVLEYLRCLKLAQDGAQRLWTALSD